MIRAAILLTPSRNKHAQGPSVTDSVACPIFPTRTRKP